MQLALRLFVLFSLLLSPLTLLAGDGEKKEVKAEGVENEQEETEAQKVEKVQLDQKLGGSSFQNGAGFAAVFNSPDAIHNPAIQGQVNALANNAAMDKLELERKYRNKEITKKQRDEINAQMALAATAAFIAGTSNSSARARNIKVNSSPSAAAAPTTSSSSPLSISSPAEVSVFTGALPSQQLPPIDPALATAEEQFADTSNFETGMKPVLSSSTPISGDHLVQQLQFDDTQKKTFEKDSSAPRQGTINSAVAQLKNPDSKTEVDAGVSKQSNALMLAKALLPKKKAAESGVGTQRGLASVTGDRAYTGGTGLVPKVQGGGLSRSESSSWFAKLFSGAAEGEVENPSPAFLALKEKYLQMREASQNLSLFLWFLGPFAVGLIGLPVAMVVRRRRDSSKAASFRKAA